MNTIDIFWVISTFIAIILAILIALHKYLSEKDLESYFETIMLIGLIITFLAPLEVVAVSILLANIFYLV
jgi:hypothetical protein